MGVSKIGHHIFDKFDHYQRRIALFKDWYKIVFPLNKIGGVTKTLHFRNGAVATLGDIFSSDISVLLELFEEDVYGLKTVDLPANPVIFDMGANIGSFTLLANNIFPDATIISYEPHPRNFSLLKKNAPFATLHQKALAGSSGKVQIEAHAVPGQYRLIEDNHEVAAIDSYRIKNKEGIDVEAVTLDQALGQFSKVHFMKVDIEGAENEIFNHVSVDTMKKIERIAMEVDAHDSTHRCDLHLWFEDFFAKCGMHTKWLSTSVIYVWR